ncbi:alpha/beta hydrolase [Williamsia sterculiae]|uniref:Acetyl esterase/lipase n=1 Tax=Williamsia sterculiae TaxID=1344003 RepID=A0A1N7F2R1_9NOCA|nr:alpha/beta hydrolase [Williamsia sterculiae]SIR94495.1 Acetyl esterase/lipase [Williamsia sterculiae]
MPITTHRRPSVGSYPIWLGARLLIRPLLKHWPLSATGLRSLYRFDGLAARGPKPQGVVREEMVLAGRPVELIMPAQPTGRDSSAAVLYLHGGAFVVCGLGTHRAVAARLSRSTQLPVFSLVYRQLPEAGVGTSAHDAYYAYRELVMERGYRHVVVAGDSAGGFLSGKIAEYAVRDGLPRPTAFVGFSPLLDLDLADNPDRSSRHDAYLPLTKMKQLAPLFDRGPIELAGVRSINELSAQILPPTVVIWAEDEMLEPDIVTLVERIDAAGGEVEGHSFRWQVHAFPAISSKHPETLQAVRIASDFVLRAVHAATRDDDSRELRGRAG